MQAIRARLRTRLHRLVDGSGKRNFPLLAGLRTVGRNTKNRDARSRQQGKGCAMRARCSAQAFGPSDKDAGVVIGNGFRDGIGGISILDKTANGHIALLDTQILKSGGAGVKQR